MKRLNQVSFLFLAAALMPTCWGADVTSDPLSVNAVRTADVAIQAVNTVQPQSTDCNHNGPNTTSNSSVNSSAMPQPTGLLLFGNQSPEIHVLTGGKLIPGTGENMGGSKTYAYELGYEQPLKDCATVTVDLLNQGHSPVGHLDSLSALLGCKVSTFNGKLKLGAAIGPEMNFNTILEPTAKGFEDVHTLGLRTSAYAEYQLPFNISLEARANWSPAVSGAPKSSSVEVGMAYKLPTEDQQSTWNAPVFDANDPLSLADYKNEFKFGMGESIYNSLHSPSGRAASFTYSRELAGPLGVEVSYLNEGDNKLFDRKGPVVQAELKKSFYDGKFDVSAAYGVMDAHTHSDVSTVPSGSKIDQIATLSSSYGIGNGWRVGLQFNRDKAPNSKDKVGDSDVIMLTFNKAFNAPGNDLGPADDSVPTPSDDQLKNLYDRAPHLVAVATQDPTSAQSTELMQAAQEIQATKTAQDSGDHEGFKYHLKNIAQIFGDSWQNLLQPGPLMTLGVGGAGYAALHGGVSEDTTNYFSNPQHKWTGLKYMAGDYMGQGLIAVPWVAVAYLTQDKKMEETSDEILAGSLTDAILTTGLKYSFNQNRPSGGSYGLPSGHSSFSFMMATVIADRYGWKAAIPAYLVASYIGFSRIGGLEHTPAQVWAGAALGTAVGFATTKASDHNFQIGPGMVNGAPGIRFKKDLMFH